MPAASALAAWSALEVSVEAALRAAALEAVGGPVTAELVRLRGARAHRCRLCQSLRNRSAVAAGGDEATFDAVDRYERSDLPERHTVALRRVDAVVWTPTAWPAGDIDPATGDPVYGLAFRP